VVAAAAFIVVWHLTDPAYVGRHVTDPPYAEQRAADQAAADLRAAQRWERDRQRNMSISACVRANRAVMERLEAPSTAVFPDCWRYDIRVKDAENDYYVRGYVDAQNSFGATLRSNFVVKLRAIADDEWQVIGAAIE
jgi:hypothetical protein